MNHKLIIEGLSRNQQVFEQLFRGISREEYIWKDKPSRWCLLEIICHLYDEEREDFRKRTKHILNAPNQQFEPIDPEGWVLKREYMKQEYDAMLNHFLGERKASINWLHSLVSPKWDTISIHPDFGEMTAQQFLANWLAHDYLHFKQITKLKLDYLEHISKESFSYAGGC
ncbi:DinB family protein [uncultured Aquimarina sp.]|uniref:DinB family protein n=1 Tax=uncultured Aquimarina sp. TaxID=575652 RepID=UPI00260B366E|nr:DinB family protein [uncultured Aquimarina sp.]